MCCFFIKIICCSQAALLLFPAMHITNNFKAGRCVLVLFVTLLFLCNTGYSQDSASLRSQATSVLLQRTKDLIKDDNPSVLLPYLEEILVRLQGLNDKDARETRAFCLYQSGACLVELERYDEAIESFQNFLDQFPDDSKAPMAALKIAEIYASTGKWSDAEKYANGLMTDANLDPERQLFAWQLLGEALYRQEKYDEALEALQKSFELAKKPRDRNSAAIMLVSCFAKQEDVENVTKFLAYCDDSIRPNAELNVALIEAGDVLLASEDYPNALILYREVLNGQERMDLYEKQNRKFEERLSEQYAARVGTSKSAFKADQERYRNQLEKNKKAMEEIRTKKGYDDELEMRIGQCYAGMGRTWPAVTLFRRFYTEFPDHDLADDARFQTFVAFLNDELWDEAIQEGAAYLTQYPDGKYPAEVAYNMMQVHMQNGEFEPAKKIGLNAREVLPGDSEYMDDISYLLGYCYFQDVEYEGSLKSFKEVYEKWPEGPHRASAHYWMAMSQLFLGKFDDAIQTFTDVLEGEGDVPQQMLEDASYRLGIALYGAERYEDSEVIFRRFLQNYPGSSLESEALSMVGDLRGAEGELDEALDFYEKAVKAAKTMEQINYATFQIAKTYELDQRYQDIVDLMEDYLAKHGDQGNFSSAGFWMGKAYKAMGQRDMALKKYIDTVVRFGNKPDNIDIDEILQELINENSNAMAGGWTDDESVMNSLKSARRDAKAEKKKALVLRLETLFANVTDGAERQKHVDAILAGAVEDAGPLTLALMASEAAAKGDDEKVHRIYAHAMAVFGDTYILVNIMNVELETLLKEGKYKEVEQLAGEIADRFGYPAEVGLTWKLKADAYRLRKKYDLAIKTYEELSGNREWRGPLTPQALYWIGMCKLELGEVEEAFAFFQRVYVMYEGYSDLAAKAYEASIRCLERLGGRTDEIIATYEEMVSKEDIASTPEGIRAREQLAKLRPGGAQ